MKNKLLFPPVRWEIWVLIPLFLAGIGVWGCEKEELEKNPEWVAAEFMQAVGKGDYVRAKQLATKETQATLEFQEKLGRMGYNPFEKPTHILRSESKGQHAKVWFEVEGRKGEEILQLRKAGNGNWRVRISKADPGSEQGVNFVHDFLEEAVPPEQRWQAMDSISTMEAPASIARRFLTALEMDDMATARANSQLATRLWLDAQHLAGDWSSPFVHQPYRITGMEIIGDTARVVFRQRSNNRPRLLRVVKDGDSWLVYIPGEHMHEFLLENTLEEWTKPFKEWYKEWENWKKMLPI